MSKNTIFYLLLSFSIFASCKKEITHTTARNLVFTATARVPIAVTLVVIRPTGLTTGVTGTEIEGAGSDSTSSPYKFTSTKIQAGDHVYIQSLVSHDQSLASALFINGAAIPYTTAIDNPVYHGYTWNFDVK